MSNPQHRELLPMNQWQQLRDSGDWALCDPFVGQQLKDPHCLESLMPVERRSPVFEEDPETSKGFNFLLASGVQTDYQMNVRVYLTDMAQPDGLGDLNQLRDFMDWADVVGFSTERSVFMSEKQRGLSRNVGGTALSVEKAHLHQLSAIAKETSKVTDCDNLTFSFNVPRAGDGSLLTLGGQRVQQIEDRVRLDLFRQENPTEPDDDFTGADMTYCAMKQQDMGAEVGAQLDGIAMEHEGKYPKKVLLLPQAEFGAIDFFLNTLNVRTDRAYATDGMTENPDTVSYEIAIRLGMIPADWVEPAQK